MNNLLKVLIFNYSVKIDYIFKWQTLSQTCLSSTNDQVNIRDRILEVGGTSNMSHSAALGHQ